MSIRLKLIPEKYEDLIIQSLEFVMDGDNNNIVDVDTANKLGFSIDEETFKKVSNWIKLGQRYEEISKSQKSEFSDL